MDSRASWVRNQRQQPRGKPAAWPIAKLDLEQSE
jgi:hypothetical protein